MKSLCCLIIILSSCDSSEPRVNAEANSTTTEIDPKLIRVWLYTSLNTSTPDLDLAVNETDSLTNETYNPSNALLVIIHGFQGTANETTLLRIKDGYLQKKGWNVILVDWAPLSIVDQYSLAVNNANHVAENLANFLNTMRMKDFVDFNKTHLLGFSIGSHIAGMIGKQVDGKIARIYALDPAFPLYNRKDLNERLYLEDAQFVQVIHTSGNFISFEDSLGHIDFYPNGGKFPQPRCLDSIQGTTGLNLIPIMICSHTMVVSYFADTVFDETKFMAKKCQSWSHFLNDSCADQQIAMGYATPDSAKGDYFLEIY